jgi:shikimate dehydrogenase
MQNEFFNNAGINAVYLAFHVKGEDLPDVAAGFKKLKELRGFNVTVPHKVEIMKYLDEVDSVAEKIGAVNTVVIDDNGKWLGYNTDWYGVFKTLEENNVSRNLKTLIIGAGGAANGVVYGLQEFGISDIAITNRTAEKAEVIAKQFDIKTLDFTSYKDKLNEYQLVINTTTIPFGKMVADFKKDAVYFDLKYYLESTPDFCIDGKAMLYYQGVKAFELWTGKKI